MRSARASVSIASDSIQSIGLRSGMGVLLGGKTPHLAFWFILEPTSPRHASGGRIALHDGGPSKFDTDSGRRTRLGFLCGREAGRLVRHESRRQAMARVADHLSVEDLEARLRSAQDPTATRHVQVIWLFARGHTIADVAAVTSFVPRWIEQLLARYNAHGPEALGDG